MIKRVILASGGLDSFLCWYIFRQDAVNVFVNIGQKYAKKEGQALRNLMQKIPQFDVVEHAGSLIGPLEDEKSGIIPVSYTHLTLPTTPYV